MSLEDIRNKHGGYWTEKGLMDYMYLVNPYFPTKKMIREIKRMSQTLITNYPACIRYMCDLASKIYNVESDHIVVGNGASELIKNLCDSLSGKTGIITPTFNEYVRLVKNKVVINDDNYTAKEIVDNLSGKIQNLVLVNPQLNTGHYLDRNEINILIGWCRSENINLILDESFIDFADVELAEDLRGIYDYENLFIIKSLSKSYGMPGLRLGVIASQNKLIGKIRKKLPIWNISSFAEYFLEIFPKYRKDFIKSLERIRSEKDRFEKDLTSIREFSVRNSFANYFLISVDGVDVKHLCEKLFENNIIIRNLSDRGFKNCIRVSVRSKKENKKFVRIVRKILDRLYEE